MTDDRACFKCGKTGHIRSDCPLRQKKSGGDDASKVKWDLAVLERSLGSQDWILDSGASRHMVNDKRLLQGTSRYHNMEESGQPDGSGLELIKQVYSLCEVNGNLAVTKGDPARVVFYADMKANVLVARVEGALAPKKHLNEVVMSAVIDESSDIQKEYVERDTLMGFHVRFGHLAYDTVERITKDPVSEIAITSHERSLCTTCAEGKQTRSDQPKKDTGAHAPVYRVGGVICSDLKGPITARDRRGNRYLVSLVDHNTNYCRIFLAKTKDQAAKYFEDFLIYFEKRFECKSEAKKLAANGKAERMHRTVMNMVRCMLLASELPLSFWVDDAEYAAYILNRRPTWANEGRKSPLEMLMGRAHSLQDIVVFGSSCAVFVGTNKKNLQKRSQPGKIVGKSEETKGYRVYLPQAHKVIITRHVSDIDTLDANDSDHISR
ncbi:unnamed protein product [Phytophthora fragariaefolia]|uniref:Unnamed protein product n=1 Tax=Phytophthora fragariaefolia TaxID=1490495 RepID=A0A9W6XSD1_9STRA|nr:unnamed protein product [Phytophthora fragariaefolia]